MNDFPVLRSDVTSCDVEPITRLNRIQSFGFLVAMSPDWTVVVASANLALLLGIEPQVAIGTTLDRLVDVEALHEIRNRMTGLASSGGSERLYGIELIKGRARFDLAVHYAGTLCVLEGEPAGHDGRMDAASLVRSIVARLNKEATLESFHKSAVRQIRSMTGFERVMIYRFATSGAGEVIAEITQEKSHSYLGLHYPATDIPMQARALYLRNPFRIIADVKSSTVALLSSASDTGAALDLTLAVTRAVSPVHIEYLCNMRVAASLSISIIVGGRLWGLIACHSGAARLPTFVVRTAAELVGQMYSMMLETRLRHESDRGERRGRDAVVRIIGSIMNDSHLLDHALWWQDALAPLVSGDGVAICVSGRLSLSGSTPSAADVRAIAQLTDFMSAKSVCATDDLGAMRSESKRHADEAAGVLYIPLSRVADDYIMVFRREHIYDIGWAGAPKTVDVRPGEIPRLSPRESFALFNESIRGRSLPFSDSEQSMAETLRSGLMDVLLRGSHHVDAERKRATERQELLIAELNHRVRNVLALIRGLISQTSGEGGDAAQYVQSLSGRVQALARAHDRVTRQNWAPGPLDAIFEDEIAAYVPTERHRFVITGASVLLQPHACSTFALIVHELVTNSAKYGSLSQLGRVVVTLDHQAGKGLYFKWSELDGPPVQVPTRRGFGSVIIERMVPFDLQGTALVQYLPAGLEADFFVPERHLALSPTLSYETSRKLAGEVSSKVAKGNLRPLEGLTVLLVEDNLIVALDTEDMLRSLGAASVQVAPSIAVAAEILLAQRVHFAVLDINLGFETSLEFAMHLRNTSVPFVFASGYGDSVTLAGTNRSVLTVSKPFDRELLGLAIVQTLSDFSRRSQ